MRSHLLERDPGARLQSCAGLLHIRHRRAPLGHQRRQPERAPASRGKALGHHSGRRGGLRSSRQRPAGSLQQRLEQSDRESREAEVRARLHAVGGQAGLPRSPHRALTETTVRRVGVRRAPPERSIDAETAHIVQRHHLLQPRGQRRHRRASAERYVERPGRQRFLVSSAVVRDQRHADVAVVHIREIDREGHPSSRCVVP